MEDIIGKKFGRLTVLEVLPFSNKGRKFCRCKCECENETIVRMDLLKRNHTRSCGCLQRESAISMGKLNKKGSNPIEEKEDYIIMKIESKGKIYDCLIDKDDYEKIKNYRWSVVANDYIESKAFPKCTLLHRYIMDCPENLYVDHINHNTFDNRRCNLRICTNSQNNMNKNSKGVSFRKEYNRYRAYITKDRKQHYLGSFKTEEEAKEARRQAEIKYFGEFRYKD